MKNARAAIRGLNYRVDDHEAVPGMCRYLENMYPSGQIDAPVWKPANNPLTIRANNKDLRARSTFVWNRANLPSLLIILGYGDNSEVDALFSIELDSAGRVPTGASATTLYSFSNIKPDREASFAQTGDNLVVSIGTQNITEKMLWARMIENSVVCVDFNANIPLPQITLTLNEDSAFNAALTYTHVYFAVRVAWELIDGTLVGLSGALVFDVEKGVTYWPKLKFTASAVSYSDSSWKKLIKGLVLFISPYVSDQVPDPATAAVRDSLFYRIALFEGLFTAQANYTYDVDWDTITTNERLETDLLLSRKAMMANTLFSNNKRILYAGVQYLFVAPQRLDGKVEAEAATPGITIPAPSWLAVDQVVIPSDNTSTFISISPSGEQTWRFHFRNTLEWEMPDLSGTGLTLHKIIVERRISFVHYKRRGTVMDPDYQAVNVEYEKWRQIATSVNPGAVGVEYTDGIGDGNNYFDYVYDKANIVREVVTDIRIEYRIKAKYLNDNGPESDYVFATYRPGADPGNPLPVQGLQVEVSGGEPVVNDSNLIIDQLKIGQLQAIARVFWALPEETVTRLKISGIKVERSWGWTSKISNQAPVPTYTDTAIERSYVELGVYPPTTTRVDDEILSDPTWLTYGESLHHFWVKYRVTVQYERVSSEPTAIILWEKGA